VLLIVALFTALRLFRPSPQPAANAHTVEHLEFAALAPGFNDLPVEERIAALRLLFDSMRGRRTSDEDALRIARFSASLVGERRDQLDENMGRLITDVLDQIAREPARGPLDSPTERLRHAERQIVRIGEIIAAATGENEDRTPQERVEEARRHARAMDEAVRSGQITAEGAGGFFGHLTQSVNRHGQPQQKARIPPAVRGMFRAARGQDPATGEPVRYRRARSTPPRPRRRRL